jgi:hypothetical protein
MMKSLSVLGTAAMFLVGGGILLHGMPAAQDMMHEIEQAMHAVSGIGPLLAVIGPMLLNALAGIVAGAAILCIVSILTRFLRGSREAPR